MGRVRNAWNALRGRAVVTPELQAWIDQHYVRRDEIPALLEQLAEFEASVAGVYSKLNTLAMTQRRLQARREKAEQQEEEEQHTFPELDRHAAKAALNRQLLARGNGRG